MIRREPDERLGLPATVVEWIIFLGGVAAAIIAIKPLVGQVAAVVHTLWR